MQSRSAMSILFIANSILHATYFRQLQHKHLVDGRLCPTTCWVVILSPTPWLVDVLIFDQSREHCKIQQDMCSCPRQCNCLANLPWCNRQDSHHRYSTIYRIPQVLVPRIRTIFSKNFQRLVYSSSLRCSLRCSCMVFSRQILRGLPHNRQCGRPQFMA